MIRPDAGATSAPSAPSVMLSSTGRASTKSRVETGTDSTGCADCKVAGIVSQKINAPSPKPIPPASSSTSNESVTVVPEQRGMFIDQRQADRLCTSQARFAHWLCRARAHRSRRNRCGIARRYSRAVRPRHQADNSPQASRSLCFQGYTASTYTATRSRLSQSHTSIAVWWCSRHRH